ncbi:MAG: Xaa-Pro peptidase family protein [Ardenticatenaceae bacterium]|nr:Xaa-Pro peptidase family protein [Ardenticatenaceae bacterium]HBY95928.1 hypothetical protein [Chloroflexota bacterium]
MADTDMTKSYYLPPSMQVADWEDRVDMKRLRRDRLARVQTALTKADVDGILLLKPENFRYATAGVGMEVAWWLTEYGVVPRQGTPYFYPTGGDMQRAQLTMPWLEGNVKPAKNLDEVGARRQTLADMAVQEMIEDIKRAGLKGTRVAVDLFNYPVMKALEKLNVEVVDGEPIMVEARIIKSQDEIALLRMAAAINDAAMYHAFYEVMRPGVRETDVTAALISKARQLGCTGASDALRGFASAGEHVNPYYRVIGGTDKILQPGELMVIDSHLAFMGYHVDYTRTYVVSGKPTQQARDLYKRNYEYLYRGIEKARPGNTTADVAAEWNEPSDWSRHTLDFGHGIGATGHEAPWVTPQAKNDPRVLEVGMVMAFETYKGGGLGIASRIEEDAIITENGPEIISKIHHDPKLLD